MSAVPPGAEPPAEPAGRPPAVEVRRSARRRRTVSAYRDGETVVVLIPARFTRAEEREWVRRMTDRLTARDSRVRRGGDAALAARAERLLRRYLDTPDERRPRPSAVRWVTNQNGRWGSCTPADGTVRLSTRLHGMPAYVIDYVLLHELAHLAVPGHGVDFWALVERDPRTQRARGFLEGFAHGQGSTPSEDPDDADVD